MIENRLLQLPEDLQIIVWKNVFSNVLVEIDVVWKILFSDVLVEIASISFCNFDCFNREGVECNFCKHIDPCDKYFVKHPYKYDLRMPHTMSQDSDEIIKQIRELSKINYEYRMLASQPYAPLSFDTDEYQNI
jgi:hypothetical protein